jgi:hypothetical protein
MRWKMFLDDERYPIGGLWPDTNEGWIICRHETDVAFHVAMLGMPYHISFDHDLGAGVPTGMDIAKTMVQWDMDGKFRFPDGFSFYVHSQNPVGKKNIESYLDSYFRFRQANRTT